MSARCPFEMCAARDPKGLYREARARAGGTMPGVHVAYDEPADADVVVDTSGPVDASMVASSVASIVARALRA